MLERSVRSSVSNSSNSFSVRPEERTKRSEVACVEAASVEVFIVCPRTLVAGRRLGCGRATWFGGSDRFTTLVRLRWLLRGDSLTSCLVIFEGVDYVRRKQRVCEVEND